MKWWQFNVSFSGSRFDVITHVQCAYSWMTVYLFTTATRESCSITQKAATNIKDRTNKIVIVPFLESAQVYIY